MGGAMDNPDIRWRQRFSNYQKALAQLAEAHALSQQRELSRLERLGLIHGFEYTYELAWNTLKDYLTYQGIQNLIGSRDTIREAFSRELIDDGEDWMAMLTDRNKTSHTYNEETAEEIFRHIVESHFYLFQALQKKLDSLIRKMMSSTHETKHGLKTSTIDKINGVFALYPNIQQAILYSSRAKGTFRNGSDIDLTLKGDNLTYRELLRIENELDDLLLPYKIDLSLFRQIENPNLIEHIERVGVVFYPHKPDDML